MFLDKRRVRNCFRLLGFWRQRETFAYLSMMTGSDGVSFLLPQLFLSQHRLQGDEKMRGGRDNGELVTEM